MTKKITKLLFLITIIIIVLSVISISRIIKKNNENLKPSFNTIEELESYLYKESDSIRRVEASSKIFYILYYKDIKGISFVTVEDKGKYTIIHSSQKMGLNKSNSKEILTRGSYGEGIYIEYIFMKDLIELPEEQDFNEYTIIDFDDLKLLYRVINI